MNPTLIVLLSKTYISMKLRLHNNWSEEVQHLYIISGWTFHRGFT
jgi:hypothetical protein